ncbi:hypothetical protein LguiB_002994 [Lonicera macranthoides]
MAGFNPLLFCFALFSILVFSTAIDTIEPTQLVRDNESIVSAGEKFRLGFFSLGNSKNRYVGIWFNKISVLTAVWVANREIPLTDSSGVLTVTNQGLTVLNGNESVIWSSNSTRSSENLVAQLLDTGNLALRERNERDPQKYVWQSFDHPCDTLIAGMKLGRNNVTGINRYLSSWTSTDDPSRGNYTFELDPRGFPQLVGRKDSVEQYCSGPWNGLRFSGTPNLKPNPYYNYNFVFNQEEAYYAYELKDSSVATRLVINLNGDVQRFMWNDRNQEWTVYLKIQIDNCDKYASCGAYGRCRIDNSPQCGCLEKFEPRYQNEWDWADWSNGCVRRKPLDCQKGDNFLKYTDVKLPDTRNSWYDRSMSLEGCKMVCLRNCSCVAYTRLDISTGNGCLLWFGELIDIREYPENGQEIYVRLAASEVGSNAKKRVRYAVSFVLTGILLLGLSLAFYLWKKKKKKQQGQEMSQNMEASPEESDTGSPKEDLELPLLNNGVEIAVKKLSKSSRQGIDEFKNEVLCIAKLQHRNLVKLLGCCIHVEKMLIYEYMPNKSLDFFIFDQQRSMLLDWPKLFNIINGISRGLLYLHQDSRLRIIHRDLKASNILLDHEMNPKISDFGMARSFRGNETEANTTRVVGTYGYMSPEYAIDGLFSVKSDVFSFGVLVLEIVSGKKNRGFYHQEHCLNLLGHAWKLHKEGRPLELMNECIRESCNLFEVLRSIHVGLLCVQQSPEDRPNMSTVVLMLSSEGELPQPKQPGFFTERNMFDTNSSLYDSASTNEITSTMVRPR